MKFGSQHQNYIKLLGMRVEKTISVKWFKICLFIDFFSRSVKGLPLDAVCQHPEILIELMNNNSCPT